MKIKVDTKDHKIKLLRYTYNSETKRTDKKLLAVLNRYGRPSEAQLEKLTDAEKKELDAFFAEERAKEDEKARQRALSVLPSHIQHAVEVIAAGEAGAMLASQNYIDKLLDSLDALKKELRKNDIKVTRSKKKVTTHKQQLDMY